MAQEQKQKKNQSKDVKPADKPKEVIKEVKAEKEEPKVTLKAEKFFNQQTRLTEIRFTKVEDADTK